MDHEDGPPRKPEPLRRVQREMIEALGWDSPPEGESWRT